MKKIITQLLILMSSVLLPHFVQGQGSGLVETNGLSLAAGVVPTSPVRLLHLQGLTQTLRVEGLGSTGTTFNVVPTLSSDALVFTSANGDFKRWSGGTSILFGRDASGVLSAIAFSNFELPLTFNSGLTRTANTVTWGGTLLATTTVAQGGFHVNFSGAGNVGIGPYAGSPIPPSKLVVGGNVKAENGFSSENGSAGAPGFRFFGTVNGPNMGMYRSVDTLFFSTKSTARLRIGNQTNGTTEMWVNLKSPYVNSDVFSATSNLTGDYGVNGYNTLTTAATGGGVYGESRSATTIGVWGSNLHALGTGIIGQGNNVLPTYLAAGQGGAFTGLTTGAYTSSTTAGVGQSLYTNQFGNIVRVNYWDGATQWKIQGAGVMPVACAIKDANGNMRALYCPESPNFKFEDQGQVQLNNGQAHVVIDPILANNIIVDADHFMHVTVTPQGDCNQLYVTNITSNGFDIVESSGGTATIMCTYELKAFVKDWDMGNGRVSTFPRFAVVAPESEVISVGRKIDTKE